MAHKAGTERTRQYYETEGWSERNGETTNRILFGVKEDGPIRVELYETHLRRVRSALSRTGTDLKLLECGCGGDPEIQLLDLCSHYTGADFSDQGLLVAATKLQTVDVSVDLQNADACDLPFEDGSFDAVYAAHMIYHIEDPRAQERALAEFLRVTRSGGVIVIIAANPRPILFPWTFLRRLVANTPVLNQLVNRIRRRPPIPYRPMSIGWTRRRLSRGGKVEVVTSGLPSTHFNQTVTEHKGIGKLLWTVIRWLDLRHSVLSSYLGNGVQYTVQKH
jgi:SAM-dependent methyltransferase